MFTIPNSLSLLRLVLSFAFLSIRPFSINFYIIFIICVVTDILDGFIARITKKMSPLGAKLDSIADLSLVFIVFYRIIPLIKIPSWLMLWIIGIVVLRFISLLVVYFKFKTFGILHTYLNKFTGVLLLLGIFLLPVVDLSLLGRVLCFFGTLSAVEELVIHLNSKVFNDDVKTYFQIKKDLV